MTIILAYFGSRVGKFGDSETGDEDDCDYGDEDDEDYYAEQSPDKASAAPDGRY